MITTEYKILQFSQLFAKVHKKLFGKGPNNVGVAVKPDLVAIKAKGVLTQLEKNLLQTEAGIKQVHQIRTEIIFKFNDFILNEFRFSEEVHISGLMFELFVETDELVLVLC